MPVVRGAIMGIRCAHENALPDAKILLHVTDKQIEEGFTYSKARYPGIMFRVYRCEQCTGMMEQAIPDMSYPMSLKARQNLLCEAHDIMKRREGT